jgi:hypothetical protein
MGNMACLSVKDFGREPTGRSTGWESNIKRDLKEVGWKGVD